MSYSSTCRGYEPPGGFPSQLLLWICLLVADVVVAYLLSLAVGQVMAKHHGMPLEARYILLSAPRSGIGGSTEAGATSLQRITSWYGLTPDYLYGVPGIDTSSSRM